MFLRRSRRYPNTNAASRRSSVAHPHPARRVESPVHTITGKAYVTDGDGIRVARQEVRLGGLDAPEWDQKARHRDDYWFSHGKRVKSAMHLQARQAQALPPSNRRPGKALEPIAGSVSSVRTATGRVSMAMRITRNGATVATVR